MAIRAHWYRWMEGNPGSDYTGHGYYVEFPDGFAFRYTIAKDRNERQVFRAKPNEKFDMYDPKTHMEVLLNPKQLEEIIKTLFTQLDDFDAQP